MVEEQLERRGIREGGSRVLAAMREVPRHLFVAQPMQAEAYDDNPLPIGEGQTYKPTLHGGGYDGTVATPGGK